jgi:hypothetical protein
MMAVYTVYVPDFGGRARSEAETYAVLPDAVFVREGFSRAAFFLGPFWLAWNRLWIVLLLWLGLFALLSFEAPRYLPAGSIVLIGFLVEFLLGLEGNALRRGELARRGFRLSDVAAGTRRVDAERVYYRRALTAIPPPVPQPKIIDAPHSAYGRPSSHEVVGLFPGPEDAR